MDYFNANHFNVLMMIHEIIIFILVYETETPAKSDKRHFQNIII